MLANCLRVASLFPPPYASRPWPGDARVGTESGPFADRTRKQSLAARDRPRKVGCILLGPAAAILSGLTGRFTSRIADVNRPAVPGSIALVVTSIGRNATPPTTQRDQSARPAFEQPATTIQCSNSVRGQTWSQLPPPQDFTGVIHPPPFPPPPPTAAPRI